MTQQEKWCGMTPRNPLPEGSTHRKRASWVALVLALVVTLAGYGLSFAQQTAEPTADLRQEVFQLLTLGDEVRDSESWSRWMRQWETVVRKHGGGGTDTLAFGQIVGVPTSPADVRYVDWEQVPYPARPSVALAHACGLMTGRLAADGTLEWAAREPLKRFEAANIAARSVELMFELLLTGAAYSRPGCPLALGAFYGDPEVIDDLLRRQEARHAEAIEELRAAFSALESLPEEMRKRLEAELERRIEFQREIKSSLVDLERRLFAELGDLEHRLRADWSEFNSMLNELRAGHAEQDARLDSLEARVTALESRAVAPVAPHVPTPVAALRADYAPVWINWTGPDGREFGPSNPYKGGEVSINLGLNAGPEALGWSIVSVTVPPDGVRANDSQELWKRSFWYPGLDPGKTHTASITVRGPSGQVITVSHVLGH